MYDRPETAAAYDKLWTLTRDALTADGVVAPAALTRGTDPWDDWQSPELILSQTCGYPYRARLHGLVKLVATPDPGLPDCPPGYYNSVLVARADEPKADLAGFAGARFAYNEALSQSGWAAPMALAGQLGLHFGSLVRTGAHRLSARAVAEGHADLAAIDAVTWGMIRRYDRFSDSLREIARTAPTPALPCITAATRDPAPIARALSAAYGALPATTRKTLGFTGIVGIASEAYLAVPNPAPPGP